ncbi:MAG: pyruvate formate lyase family protein [bacterium]
MSAATSPTRAVSDPERERIDRIRRRYQTGDSHISVERARYYTQSWKSTVGEPRALRVAKAMRHVYANMTHYLDPDDRIAGAWTEHFLGVPLDIERGVFNLVLEAELTRTSMVLHRGRAIAKGVRYMIRKRALGDFMRNQRIARASGTPPLNMGLQTMSQRKINPFVIAEEERRELLGELLPWWRGRTIADRLEAALSDSDLLSDDMHDFAVALPGNTSRQVSMLATCATIATIQGHVILDYETVLERGLRAMHEEVRQAREALPSQHGPEWEFLKSVELALDGVMLFARRLAERIERTLADTVDPHRRQVLAQLLERCRNAPLEPPRTFAEAVQALWTVKTAVELAHPMNLHCFGRLDQCLIAYYRRDLAAGRTTEEDARVLLEELLLKIMTQNVRLESNLLTDYYHRFLGSSPVTVGGLRPDGRDGTNELTSLFIRAAHRSRAVTNLSIRVSEETPDAVFHELAQCLAEGTSSYSLFNDELTIEAMRRRGFAEQDARNYAISGCVEAICPGKSSGLSATALLLNRLLDITLRNGDSALMAGRIRGEGLRTGDPDDFQSFDELLAAFHRQGRHFIEKIVEGSNLRDRLYAEYLPAPHISAFLDGCFERRRDVTQGGSRYDLAGISMINAVANVVDSLCAIKQLVFEERSVTVRELLEALDHNFLGYEQLHRRLRDLPGKWGNGDPETDQLAHRIMKGLFEQTYQYQTVRGGPFVVYLISMITHTIDGRLSIASPDGRPAATPFAASCNPYNVERFGATAAMRSVAALPFEDVLGCAVNMKFHPSAIGDTPETRAKWIALIRTYFQLGGAQLQPTAVSAEVLQQARERPEEHRDLIVKVGGYSTYFVDLGSEIQDEIIARTEHSAHPSPSSRQMGASR